MLILLKKGEEESKNKEKLSLMESFEAEAFVFRVPSYFARWAPPGFRKKEIS